MLELGGCDLGREGGRNEHDLPGVTILPVDMGREKLQLGLRGHHRKGVSWERISVAKNPRDGRVLCRNRGSCVTLILDDGDTVSRVFSDDE